MFYKNTSIEYISSKSNSSIVLYGKLQNKKYRVENNEFICEGYKLVLEASKYGKVDAVLVSESVYRKNDENITRTLGLLRDQRIK